MQTPRRILLCPPTHYRVAYEINPWMNLRRQPYPARALRQWRRLHALVGRLADPVEIAPLAGAPDMVFTANAGFTRGGRVLLSRFRHAERRIEQRPFREWFVEQGLQTVDCPPGCCFEGEGDALHDPDDARIWYGHGIRSDLAAATTLAETFDAEVIPLRLISAAFYHLDTCLCPLPGGAVMLYPPALAAESRLRLYGLVPPQRRIEVDSGDAHAFACNALLLGRNLIVNRVSADLRARLVALGLHVIETPVDEFMRAGGAVKCLTLNLD